MFCYKCGAQLPDEASFCWKCGESVVWAKELLQPRPPAQKEPEEPRLPATKKKTVEETLLEMPTENLGMNTQIPDPTFSKFIDPPTPNLPFRSLKIVLGGLSVLPAGGYLYRAWQLGAFEMFKKGAEGPYPGALGLILACLLLVGAVCAITSKKSRGAATAGGIFYAFSAAVAFTTKLTYQWLLPTGVLATISAAVLLISAAGGIRLSFEPAVWD